MYDCLSVECYYLINNEYITLFWYFFTNTLHNNMEGLYLDYTVKTFVVLTHTFGGFKFSDFDLFVFSKYRNIGDILI